MNKKFVASVCSFCILLSILFGSYVISADSVNSIVVTSGAVSGIISFTCTDSTDAIRIYYGESSGITTGDNSTYIDPTECDFGNRANRRMLIQGLTEDTTYYYRIYAVGEGWSASEDSFETLSRFTDVWQDEFFDAYLIDDNSSVDIVQQIGVKSGTLIDAYETGGNVDGMGYVSVSKEGAGDWKCFGTNYSDLKKMNYLTSADGVTWSYVGKCEVSPAPTTTNYPCVRNISGMWYSLYKEVVGKTSIANRTTPFGTYYETLDGAFSNYGSNNEAASRCYFNDTLGANTYTATGQSNFGAIPARDCGRWVALEGLVDDSWLCLDEDLPIPACTDEGGGFSTQIYDCPVYIKSGVYVGMSHYFEAGAWTVYPFLVVSRNGYDQWEIVDPDTPIIPLGSGGSFDDGMIYTSSTEPVIEDDFEYFYYNGWDDHHETTPRNTDVARIRFRINGMTALEPSGPSEWVRTISIPYNFSDSLVINGNFSNSNKLNISVLDADDDSAYPGFSTSDFTTISTNGTELSCAWGVNTISGIPEGDFKLNFTFDGADGQLFSYSLSPLGDSPAPQFTSINTQLNNTIVYTGDRTFIWTNRSGTQYYQLQIANDSSFTDVFVDLNDINLTNYPTNYSDTATNITFILPPEYIIQWDTYHYYRVRAYYIG